MSHILPITADPKLRAMLENEWWITNGSGGYCSSTVSGANTRKYHGLYVASHKSAADRYVLLSKLEDTAITDKRHDLSTNIYPNAIYPKGYTNISTFSYDTIVARWDYDIGQNHLIKQVWCPKGEDQTLIRYTLKKGNRIAIEARPFVNARSMHSIGLDPAIRDGKYTHMAQRSIFFKSPFLWGIQSDSGLFRPYRQIYKNILYPKEEQRKEPFSEDLLSPGSFQTILRKGESITIRAMRVHKGMESKYPKEPQMSLARIGHLKRLFFDHNGFVADSKLDILLRSTDQFVINTESKPDIVAGYPYFGAWARDTMISLPGVCIHTGRHTLAKRIIDSWIIYQRDGILPNRIDEHGRPSYESADGFLWMLWAMSELDSRGGFSDLEVQRWWPKIDSGLRSWIDGNRYVQVDKDGLVVLKEPRLTWMDAMTDGYIVTPRTGKRVEINALFVNALRFAKIIAEKRDDKDSSAYYSRQLKRSRASMKKFQNNKTGCLDDGLDDDSIRPNQFWALSLDCGIQKAFAKKAYQKAKAILYAPTYGLRTLSADDPDYKPNYSGSMHERDLAYHQGTIWPWLIGCFTQSSLLYEPKNNSELESEINESISFERPGTMLSIPEVYDPASLNQGGCPLQAWSVAESLRALVLLKRHNLQNTKKNHLKEKK